MNGCGRDFSANKLRIYIDSIDMQVATLKRPKLLSCLTASLQNTIGSVPSLENVHCAVLLANNECDDMMNTRTLICFVSISSTFGICIRCGSN
jgi:hypothetical protein